MTGDLRGLAARLNAINNGATPGVHDPLCNDSCVGDTHALVAVDVQTGTPIDDDEAAMERLRETLGRVVNPITAEVIARVERRLAEERDAAPADGTLWHRGARAAFARAIDIVREATA